MRMFLFLFAFVIFVYVCIFDVVELDEWGRRVQVGQNRIYRIEQGK